MKADRALLPAAAILASLVGTGCVKPEVEPQFLPAFEPFDASDPRWMKTRPVLLISDCQIFNVESLPVPERNLSAQSMVPTAIRSPQLNLFTTEVLRWIVADDEVPTEGILHLGDALDLACEGEFLQFADVMSVADRPWLMTPGNHDCFYFGNYDPQRPTNWENGCYTSGAPFTKDRFVRYYVAALLQQRHVGFDLLADSLGLTAARELELPALADQIPDQHTWHAPAGSGAYLTDIEWSIDMEQPWRSYVLQAVDLSSGPEAIQVRGLLLDSCQYERRPVMLPNAWRSYPLPLNAGFTGQMLADQLRSLRAWLEDFEDRDYAGMLMCHHPVKSWEAKSRASLFWMLEQRSRTAMVITAHTHAGHYAYHPLGGDRQMVELNLGSTTDWPMEWRTLEVFYDPHEGARELYLRSQRFLLADRLRNRQGYFQTGWEVPFGELDDYRAYRQGVASTASITDIYLGYHLRPPLFGPANVHAREGSYETEARYKVGLLNTFARLLRGFPTDMGTEGLEWPAGCSSDAEVLARIEEAIDESVSIEDKIALLVELQPFERKRESRDPDSGVVTDADRTRYKLSQAVWASRYGYTRGRTLQPEDELVRVRLPDRTTSEQPAR